MTKQEYKNRLKNLIKAFGYWSNEVNELNNIAHKTFGYKKYVDLHDEVRIEENK